MSTHGTRSHPSGIGGARIRTTHYSKPPVVDPVVEGMPSYKAREGEAVQIPDLGERIIETGHFDLGAAAPQVNNNPLAPVDAEVIIDTEGITIKNGKLFLQDYGGNSVLGPAGFDGSWIDFLSAGVYNGRFRAGAEPGVGSSVETIVGTAHTTADYEASLSPAVPYWVIEEVVDSAYQIASLSTVGRSVSVSKLGAAAGSFTMFQDVPVRSNGLFRTTVEFDLVATITEAGAGNKVELYLSELDADHAQVPSGEEDALWKSHEFDTIGTFPVYGSITDIALRPETQYLRVRLKVTLRATAVTHTTSFGILGVGVKQSVWSNHLWLRDGGGLWWRDPVSGSAGLLTFTSAVEEGYRFNYSADMTESRVTLTSNPLGAGPAYFEVRDHNQLQPYARMGYDGSDAVLKFGPGGSAVPDTAISRVAAGVLSIQGLRLAGAGSSFPVSATIGDLYYRTDLGELCEYDGARWLGQMQTTRMSQIAAAAANSNADYNLMLSRSVKLVRWRVNTLTLTTNNGSNFWTIRLRDATRSSVLSGSHGSQSLSGDGTTAWTPHEVVNTDVVSVSQLGLLFDFFKTGSPGALHFYGDVQYRPIYT